MHHALVDYVVRVIAATRKPAELGLDDVAGWVSYGASPRASLGIIAASRALALIRGRDYVIPQDVLEVIPDVLRHRLVLSYDALADEVSPEDIITKVLQTVGLPQVAPQAIAPVPPAAGARAVPAAGAPAATARVDAEADARTCADAAAPRGAARQPQRAVTTHPPSFRAGELTDPRLAAALRTLELTVRRRLDGVLHGDHLGLIPGPGSEPGDARLYQPGDDVRQMDWSVTARTTHPHVRQIDRRPGTRDVDGRGPVGEPRLRQRGLRET